MKHLLHNHILHEIYAQSRNNYPGTQKVKMFDFPLMLSLFRFSFLSFLYLDNRLLNVTFKYDILMLYNHPRI